MARTELPNGVILPAEYSDDWYEDMTSNLTKLDNVIGSDSEKLNSNDVAFLRMSSAALTDGGTGNFSDLNSSNKLKTGDYVLDSGRKLYQVVSVDSTNETFTVGNSLFKITAESDLAPVAESGDYDDLDNKPDLKPVATSGDYDDLDNKPDLKPVATSGDYDDLTDLPAYGIIRFCSSAITDNSSVAFSNISSTDKIKIGDFLLDTNGKLYQISSVDTSNETVSVTTPLTQLAVDSGVMHLSGNESASGDKNFQGLLTTIPNGTIWPANTSTTDDITYLGANAIHVEQKGSGKLTDLSGGAWSVAELGLGCFFFRINNGADIRYKHLGRSEVYRIPVVSGANRFINDVTPDQDNTYDLGSSSLRWRSINGINPGALSLPDLSNGINISGYITDLTGASNVNKYTPTVDGWISIGISNAEFIELYVPTLLMGGTFTKSTANNNAQAFMPVVANKEVKIALKGSAVGWAKFFPCKGNV